MSGNTFTKSTLSLNLRTMKLFLCYICLLFVFIYTYILPVWKKKIVGYGLFQQRNSTPEKQSRHINAKFYTQFQVINRHSEAHLWTT